MIVTGDVRHGADEVLGGVFWDLGQIGEGGDPKYPEAVLRRLAAKILDGRAHEVLVFRLCHLVRCVSVAGGGGHGWLEFFCAPQAGRAGWAAGWLRARLPAAAAGEAAPVSAAADGVALRYAGRAAPVTVSYGAMPLLAAFMEFLLNTLQYDVVRDGIEPLSRRDLAWRELQDASNALSRAVYAWLREHTRPVQDSRDFEEMARFLMARGEGGDFAAGDIDDAAVLEFWRAASLEEGSGFVTFRKTFRAFLRLAGALREEALRAGVDRPETLDDAGGWLEPADPSSPGLDRMRAPAPAPEPWSGAGDEEDAASPLEELAASEIRILLAEEAKRLALVDAHWRDLPALARSLLRDAAFGHAQGRISQALRTGAGDLGALVREPPAIRYEDEAASLERLLEHFEDLIAAAAFVLLEREGTPDGTVELDFAVAGRGRRALRAIRRKGFDDLRAGAPAAVDSLRDAVPAIIALRDRLSPLCARLRPEGSWQARQEEDERVFRAQFARLYGARGNEDREGGS